MGIPSRVVDLTPGGRRHRRPTPIR